MTNQRAIHRIVCFGDSTTAPREKVDVYSNALERTFPEVTVINRGQRGDTTTNALQRFRTDVLELLPDIVIIQFGINDAAVDVWKDPATLSSRVGLSAFATNLRKFIDQIQAIQGRVLLLTPNQLRWTEALLALYGKAPYKPKEERGFNGILQKYAEAVRTVAREKHIELIDIYMLYDRWEESTHRSCSELLLDGIHPNTSGHSLVAQELITVLKKL